MRPITDPTALKDQLDAATADARRHLATIAACLAGAITPATPDEWLSGHLSALRDALHAQEVRSCPHLEHAPAVAHAAIWAPGILACTACAPLLLRPTAEEDWRCDRCRRTADLLHPGMVAAGPILLAYGLCDPCRAATHPPLFQPTTRPAPDPRPATRTAPGPTAPPPPRSRTIGHTDRERRVAEPAARGGPAVDEMPPPAGRGGISSSPSEHRRQHRRGTEERSSPSPPPSRPPWL